MQDSEATPNPRLWIFACALTLACTLILACGSESPDPAAVDAYQRAVEHSQAGRFEQAEAELTIAVQAAPDVIEFRLLQGALAERLGRLEDATAAYQAAQQLDATHPNPPLHLERIARKVALDARILEAQDALAEASEPAEAHLALGDLYAERMLSEPAAHHYSLALRHAPDDARAHAGLAVVLVGVRRQVVGLHHATEALRLAPDNARAKGELLWVLATSNDESLRDPEEAIRLALESPVKTSRILDALAAAYAQTGRQEEATETADAAIELATRDGDHVAAQVIRARRALYARGGRFVGPPLDPT